MPDACYLLLFLTVILLAPAPVLAQDKAADKDTSTAGFSPELLNISGPSLVTDVAELQLKGKNWTEQLDVPDLDIYMDDAGRRFVPLLRLLRLLKATGGIDDNVITFSVSKGMKSQIDMASDKLRVGPESRSIHMVKGVSDITGKAELYVQDNAIADAFGVSFSWDDLRYAYTLKANQTLRVFEDTRQPHSRRIAVQQLSDTLEETESVHLPADSHQLVSVIDAGARLDIRTLNNSETSTIETLRPDVTFYGQLLDGNYFLHLTEDINYPDGRVPKFPLWIDEGLWTHETDHNVTRVGDTLIGWSDLVVPSTTLSGVTVRGLYGEGSGSDRANPFLSGNRFNFMAERAFDGFAPLGSSVDLYVNNFLVDSTIVDESDNAPPGQGRYEFVATGLLNRALNEIRIVITESDGTREERTENIAGSSALLPAGQWAYSAGVGTRREQLGNQAVTHGLLAGAGYYTGLTRDATFGLSLASQDEFVPDYSQTFAQRLPKRSYLGQSLAYRLTNNILLRQEAAMNYVADTGDTPKAATLGMDYVNDSTLLTGYLFSYGEDYSNGTTAIANRQGYAMFGTPTLDKRYNLSIAFAHTQEKTGQRSQDYLTTQGVMPFSLANSKATLRLDRAANKNGPLAISAQDTLTMYSVGFKSQPRYDLLLELDEAWGDRIDPVTSTDLRYGVNIPLIGFTPSYGTRLKGEYSFGNYSRFSTTYYDYGNNAESVEFYLSRMPRQANHFDSTLRLRRDLRRGDNNIQLNAEYPFDHKRHYLIGMGANYSDLSNDIRYNLYLTARDLLFIDGGTVGRIGGNAFIQPEMGGLRGFVYLDANGDGHYQKGEPGVGGVGVIVDGRQRYTSDDSGHFFVGRSIHHDEVVVELNEADLPAIYTPTQGRQRTRWDKYVFTRVNLGVTVTNSVSGEVSVWQNGKQLRPLPGAVVKVRRVGEEAIIKQSISDNRGIYYLGGLKPGQYELVLEKNSVPPSLRMAQAPPRVELPVSLNPTDLENINIHLLARE